MGIDLKLVLNSLSNKLLRNIGETNIFVPLLIVVVGYPAVTHFLVHCLVSSASTTKKVGAVDKGLLECVPYLWHILGKSREFNAFGDLLNKTL